MVITHTNYTETYVLQSRYTFVCIGSELVSGPELHLSTTEMMPALRAIRLKAPTPSVLQLEDPSWYRPKLFRTPYLYKYEVLVVLP